MRSALLAVLGLAISPLRAQEAESPLSAIDWLSQSVEAGSSSPGPPPLAEPPVASDASAPTITVTPLDAPFGGARGVLPSEVTGLPPNLWSASDEERLLELLSDSAIETLPALQDLLVTLMLAEADPPTGSNGSRLFLARVDRLLDMGALEAARSLLESGNLLDPEIFRRWFDVTLLTGTESDACAVLKDQPALAPTLMARVFCLARNGDWNAAALTLSTARALGDVSPDEEILLTRFLDPEYASEETPLLPQSRPSPLVYRIKEAIGELMPTAGLPLAFSYADLRDTVAWRAQIEAAERLARHGALSENVLLRAYTARTPAASGGVWDRASAIQEFDRALRAGDRAAAAVALPAAWAAMSEADLEVPFAKLYGESLMSLGLDGDAGALAFRVELLSPAYEAAARAHEPSTPEGQVWRAVATGDVAGVQASEATSMAVLEAFREPHLGSDLTAAVSNGQVGEAILLAMQAFGRGLDGDSEALTQAIGTLRAVGLEDVARRATLQYLLLDART